MRIIILLCLVFPSFLTFAQKSKSDSLVKWFTYTDSIHHFSITYPSFTTVPSSTTKEKTIEDSIVAMNDIRSKIQSLKKLDSNFKQHQFSFPDYWADNGMGSTIMLLFVLELDGTSENIMLDKNSPTKDKRLTDEAIRFLKKSHGRWGRELNENKNKLLRSYVTKTFHFNIKENGGESPIPYFSKFQEFVDSVKQYPKKALEKNIKGEVELKFTVKDDGSIENIFLHKGSEQKKRILVREAKRILLLSNGRWRPASKNGVNYQAERSVRIVF